MSSFAWTYVPSRSRIMPPATTAARAFSPTGAREWKKRAGGLPPTVISLAQAGLSAGSSTHVSSKSLPSPPRPPWTKPTGRSRMPATTPWPAQLRAAGPTSFGWFGRHVSPRPDTAPQSVRPSVARLASVASPPKT